ncbi:MAG: CHASE2 domain-containing protein [Pseudoxanthomonas sp.]
MNPSLPTQRIKARAATALGAAALAALLALSGATARVDAWCHDVLSRLTAPAPDPRIVVVAIDQASLSELGPWPWPRRVHARLVDRLTAIGVRGVALDVLLTEPALYDPEGDALLARALRRNGRAVLPVQVEGGGGKPMVELPPIPEFAAAAAALGHAGRATDGDGVSRGVFLHAGLGAPRWPALALALRDPGDRGASLPDPRDFDGGGGAAAQRWTRSGYRLVSFARPADGFLRVSYADVLAGRVDDARLHDRWVLVGSVDANAGDRVAIPFGAGDGARLPEVEYHANVLNALVDGAVITPMRPLARSALAAALAALPLLLLGLPGLRRLWQPLLLAGAATVLLALALPVLADVWFPPTPALLVLALGALLWRLRKLRDRRHLAQTDALTGLANRERLDAALAHELQAVRHHGQPLSLLMVDVDRFRQLVAVSGKEAGDAALRTIADALRKRARRPRDLVARIGGDEFVAMLPETSAHAAAAIATTLHVDLAGLAGKRGETLPADACLTVSIGIHTVAGGDACDAATALSCVETALYQARQLGRNRSFTFAGNAAGETGAQTPP